MIEAQYNLNKNWRKWRMILTKINGGLFCFFLHVISVMEFILEFLWMRQLLCRRLHRISIRGLFHMRPGMGISQFCFRCCSKLTCSDIDLDSKGNRKRVKRMQCLIVLPFLKKQSFLRGKMLSINLKVWTNRSLLWLFRQWSV